MVFLRYPSMRIGMKSEELKEISTARSPLGEAYLNVGSIQFNHLRGKLKGLGVGQFDSCYVA